MNWKVKVLAAGGVVGVAMGLLGALLYIRTVIQAQGDTENVKLPAVQTGDGLRIFISAVMLVRSIAGLAESE